MSKLSALERLKKPVMKGERCLTCERFGACVNWVIWASEMYQVPAEFIAQKVLRGLITHNTAPEEIQRMFEQEWKVPRKQRKDHKGT